MAISIVKAKRGRIKLVEGMAFRRGGKKKKGLACLPFHGRQASSGRMMDCAMMMLLGRGVVHQPDGSASHANGLFFLLSLWLKIGVDRVRTVVADEIFLQKSRRKATPYATLLRAAWGKRSSVACERAQNREARERSRKGERGSLNCNPPRPDEPSNLAQPSRWLWCASAIMSIEEDQ